MSMTKLYRDLLLLLALSVVALTSFAQEQEEREVFEKWRIGVGAAFNFNVKANVRCRQLPQPAAYAVPVGLSKERALSYSENRRWQDGAAFIEDDGGMQFDTENWRLPDSDAIYDRATSTFTLDNPYEEVLSSRLNTSCRDDSDDEWQFGVSVDFSRELWIHDEKEEHRWGLDFAAAFSYFFKRDIYSVDGVVRRADEVQDGTYRTTVQDPAAMWDYDHGIDSSVGGMYGYGDLSGFSRTGIFPAIGWSTISAPSDEPGSVRDIVSSCGYNASGDYRELEMLFMLRPWYEIKDWWRVFGEIGVGVSWGKFEVSFNGGGAHADEDFAQWDCYGVAGLGTAFRYGHWDLGIDFLGRFWRDDLEVEGRYARGTIERADWGFRVMLSYSF